MTRRPVDARLYVEMETLPLPRIAVNARSLEREGPPLSRRAAAHFVQQLSRQAGLRLDLVATESIPAIYAGDLPVRVVQAKAAPFESAIFDQFRFPRAAKDLGAGTLLVLHPAAPIVAAAPTVVWYGDGIDRHRRGRLERSLAQAGLRGAAAVLRPFDLPADPSGLPWVGVPPSVPEDFYADSTRSSPLSTIELPEAFVLGFGEPPRTLPLLLAAWTWVESSLGDNCVLLLVVHDERARRSTQETANQMGLSETVRAVVLPEVDWPAVFRRAGALLHGGDAVNAAALRWALAAEIPVAAPATSISESILGRAGYLVSPAEARTLGAACLTLLVEEEMGASLRADGRKRATAYHPRVAAPAWAEALRQAAARTTARAR